MAAPVAWVVGGRRKKNEKKEPSRPFLWATHSLVYLDELRCIVNTHGIVFTLKTPIVRGPLEYVNDKTVSIYLRYVQTFRKII